MIFIENKYTKLYYSIIFNAQSRVTIIGYTELHHIIPKSLGGLNNKENLVRLSAREHFICHWLLTKMVFGSKQIFQMRKAFNCMLYMEVPSSQERYKVSSKIFENSKIIYSKMFSEQMMGENNPMFGKIVSEETRKKLSIANANYKASPEARQKISDALKGRKFSEEWCTKISISKKNKYSGEHNPMFGKTHSHNSKLLQSEKAKNRSKIECQYCCKICDISNYSRWHGDKCKMKPNID